MSAAALVALGLAATMMVIAVLLVEHGVRLGSINGRYLRPAPRIDDPRIGRSRGLPIAMRFRLAEDSAGFPGGAGRTAHRAHFAGRAPLSLVIKYACARPDLFGRSDFANPESIWYAVFTGYYEVHVDQEAWGRPFAYDVDESGGARLRPEDLTRLVRADWNHLSAAVYGVPSAVVEAADAMSAAEIRDQDHGRVRKQGWDGAFDEVSFENVPVVGPYAAPDDAGYCDRGVVGFVWRRAFGTHGRPAAGVASFEPCAMRLRAYVCFRSARDDVGRAIWQTFVFGAAVNQRYDRIDAAENARFLALQVRELERIIAGERGLGFAVTAPADTTNAHAALAPSETTDDHADLASAGDGA